MEAAVAAAGSMVYVNTVVLVQARLGLGEEAVALAFAGEEQDPTVVAYLRAKLLDDVKADHLDAVLCCLVAAWAAKRADSHYGLPKLIDPVEGWIAGVPPL